MSKILSSFIIAAVAITIPTSYIYAQDVQNKKPETSIVHVKSTEPITATIRVTSTDPNQPNIKIDGSILSSSYGKESNIDEIHTTTPWEITVTEDYIRYILKTNLNNPMIQVETISSSGSKGAGTGHVFDGTESNCHYRGCVPSGIAVLN